MPVRHRLKSAITAISAAGALCALVPGVTEAAVRPLGVPVVEFESAGYSERLWVHGTYAQDNLQISRGDGSVRVWRADRGPIQTGHHCSWDDGRKEAVCPVPGKMIVHLHAGSDQATLKWGTRFRAEVWGGHGQDFLKVEHTFAPVSLVGGEDADVLVGSDGTEALFGGPGDDHIVPGGGPDHIDGGHGAFTSGWAPMLRSYVDDPGECGARTHGYWDRFDDTQGSTREGYDTLDLSSLGRGALVDLNVCRLGWHTGGAPGLVHGIERVYGTPLNDRLVGDDDHNFLQGGPGQDWVTGEGGADTIVTRDGLTDTVKCSPGGDALHVDPFDQRLGC